MPSAYPGAFYPGQVYPGQGADVPAPPTPTPTVAGGSWYELIALTAEARQLKAEGPGLERRACPNDGEPYRTGPDGQLFCPYDGHRPGP